MGKIYEHIDAELAAWIAKQELFFVATAPLSPDGHINNSPKGGDSFRVINEAEVAYQDYTGSGAETIAHLRENGRILIMFCAFEGSPNIVRLHGHGEAVTEGHPRFLELTRLFPPHSGTRSIIHVTVNRIADSCGYGVPVYEFKNRRDALDMWSTKRGDDGLKAYRQENNSLSIDGLPALDSDTDPV